MIDLVAELALVLSTGHSSPEEILLLTRAAKERGVEQVLATNPVLQNMSVPQMVEAADLGAYIEFIYYSASPTRPNGNEWSFTTSRLSSSKTAPGGLLGIARKAGTHDGCT